MYEESPDPGRHSVGLGRPPVHIQHQNGHHDTEMESLITVISQMEKGIMSGSQNDGWSKVTQQNTEMEDQSVYHRFGDNSEEYCKATTLKCASGLDQIYFTTIA